MGLSVGWEQPKNSTVLSAQTGVQGAAISYFITTGGLRQQSVDRLQLRMIGCRAISALRARATYSEAPATEVVVLGLGRYMESPRQLNCTRIDV